MPHAAKHELVLCVVGNMSNTAATAARPLEDAAWEARALYFFVLCCECSRIHAATNAEMCATQAEIPLRSGKHQKILTQFTNRELAQLLHTVFDRRSLCYRVAPCIDPSTLYKCGISAEGDWCLMLK